MTQRWDASAYRHICRVAGQPSGRLEIQFDNRDTFTIDGRRLVRPGTGGFRWEEARPGEFRDAVEIPRADGDAVAIPWDVIRSLSDDAFAAHCAQQAEQQARQIGAKLRAMREARGLPAKDVASRAGISAQSMYRIEHGKHHVILSTVGRILAAMGYSYRDLAADEGDDGGGTDASGSATPTHRR